MRSPAIFLLFGAPAAALISLLSAADPAPLEREKAFGDRYAVLIERNIFSKNRPQRFVRAGERDRQDPRPTPPSPEESLVLTGVARQGKIYLAFIENTRTGSTVKAKIGDAVARGKIAGISPDGLTYESEGKSVALVIGKTLAGGTPGLSRSSGTKASGEKAAEAAGSGPASDVLERLRQRRLQEMKK